ncbi:methyltransferase [Streptoverticillium reticulum]|uniref:methyltransferase n=1 Tax=Streptoverticillium reticulum TaxID=1433415 RepID=UPI0039BF606F
MRDGIDASVTAEPLLQMAADFYRWRTVLFAIELDLFTVLGAEPATEPAVRQRFGLDERGTRHFLDALVSSGLLDRTDGRYAPTPLAARFLDSRTASHLGRFLGQADARWARIGEGLRSGAPQNGARATSGLFTGQHRDQAAWRAYYGGMDALNGPSGAALAQVFDWSSVKRVTDVGGARGNVCAELVRAHPHLQATVFDLPPVQAVFDEHMVELGLEGRVGFRAGDFFTDPLPASDAVVFGHVLHDWGVEERRILARKAFQALEPGGVALVYDTMIDAELRSRPNSLLISLNMMLCTPGGSEYTPAEGGTWFTEAGFDTVESVPLVNDDVLLIARRSPA